MQFNQDDLTAEQQDKLCTLIAGNSEIFALDQTELGTTGIVKHSVNTGDHHPIRQHPRRTPFRSPRSSKGDGTRDA